MVFVWDAADAPEDFLVFGRLKNLNLVFVHIRHPNVICIVYWELRFRMNRSSRVPESAETRQPQVGRPRMSISKEREEELELFLEMGKEQGYLLLPESNEVYAPAAPNFSVSPSFEVEVSMPPVKTVADDFLNSDNDKNDYDWLLTPPGTPVSPSLEMEVQNTIMSRSGTPNAHSPALKSRSANTQEEPSPRSNLVSRKPTSSAKLSSNAAAHRPSTSGGPGSRPATPTRRPPGTNTSKPSRPATPTSRTMLTNTSKPSRPTTLTTLMTLTNTSKPSRPAAPVSQPTLLSKKPSTATRPSTLLKRSSAKSLTPTRATLPTSKPAPRAATPARRPSISSSVPKVPSKPMPEYTSSGPITPSRNQPPSRATSLAVKSRPWKPAEMPGYSLDAPPNLRTTLPGRPLSASRGRPAPNGRSPSVEVASNGRLRRQSCSPSRGRLSNGVLYASGSSVPAGSCGHSKINDNMSPVVFGTKMVERVINTRKLAPPKQDDKHSAGGNLSGKPSSSLDSSGFGRTLSKKSLDMAIRHMDIRRSIPGNLRPLLKNIPASSIYSVRPGPTRSKTVSMSDSPLATSSNASSELSVNNNAINLDGSELDYDLGSDRGVQSAANLQGR